MSIASNLTGERFSRLVVLRRAGTRHKAIMWLCLCDCGTETTVSGKHLRSGGTRSCGCLMRETAAAIGRIVGPINGHASAIKRRHATVTYASAHTRVYRARGRATGHTCPCGEPAEGWAYDHDDPNEMHGTTTAKGCTSLCAYSLDPEHYVAMCRLCHAEFDTQARAAA